MFKSKKFLLIYSIILFLLFIFSIVEITINWNRLMETNRMRLFIFIVWSILFAYKAIDNFLEWRNYGKSLTKEE